ncbi:MAG: hypothetical protein BWK78_05485 [Thiotrichaceae bacterium IS1]|nr:MAG: hypothetical protein BWK78_05485 [Thiotrichaceae bacterium IS1]
MSDWGDIFAGLAELAVGAAVVGGVACAVSSSMDKGIDQLVKTSEEEAIPELADQVPRMDNDTWNLFYDRLTVKAQHNDYARGLLAFSICVRRSMAEIEQLLSYSIQEALSIITEVFPQKEEIEKLAFFGTLNTYAGENVKAKAIFGRLQATLGG